MIFGVYNGEFLCLIWLARTIGWSHPGLPHASTCHFLPMLESVRFDFTMRNTCASTPLRNKWLPSIRFHPYFLKQTGAVALQAVVPTWVSPTMSTPYKGPGPLPTSSYVGINPATQRPRPPPNRRRDKPQLSCNLCRRRKYVRLGIDNNWLACWQPLTGHLARLKCDRNHPCSTCEVCNGPMRSSPSINRT